MIHDAAAPPPFAPASSGVERRGVFFSTAGWTPDALADLTAHLEGVGGAALAGLPAGRILDAWCETVQRFRDPASAESEAVRPALVRLCGLSRDGLAAGLEAVLGGVDRRSAARLFAEARTRAPGDRGLVAVILAGNLPALAVQPMLPALALGRPLLLKSPSSEPLFAPAFVRALGRTEPALRSAVAAITWRGGERTLEAPVLERAATVLVYGDQPAVDSVAERARGRCVTYGPKTSLAVLSDDVDPTTTAEGLARDVALFDQRGCLSVQAVYTDGEARPLAAALAAALERQAERWPAGPLDPGVAAGVQQVRLEARLRGLYQPDLPLATGTVVVDPVPDFQPSPGLRTVRVHPLADLDQLVPLLAGWRGRLQGAALAGDGAWRLESALAGLGISRCAAPGSLQSPDAMWHNGGLHPLQALEE
jgi:hypothetical protein